MQPPKTQRPQKLRASCDGCYTAKLKCSKERPGCHRCRNLRIECHYSPSQRMGKPRQQSTTQQPDEVAVTQQSSAITSTMTSAVQSPQTSHASPWHNDGSTNPLHPLGSSHTTSTASLHSFEDAFSISHSYPSPSATSPVAFPDQDFLAWEDPALLKNEDSVFKLGDTFAAFTDSSFPTDFHSSSSSSATGPTFSSSSDSGTCNCYRSVLEALHAVQSAAANPWHNGLDSVLNDTKDIVQKGEAMLNCTCSEDSTLIMLLAGLIAKHLSFFRPGDGSSPPSPTLSPPPLSPTGSTGSTSLSSTTSLNSSLNSGVPSMKTGSGFTRISIGKYTMDGEDEERLLLEIASMELQKLKGLLSKFHGKFANLPASSDRQTYEALLYFLNRKLRDATLRLESHKQRSRIDMAAQLLACN